MNFHEQFVLEQAGLANDLATVANEQAESWAAYADKLSVEVPPIDPPIEPPVPPVDQALQPGIYDDTALTYSENWVVGSNITLYQGHDHYTNEPGSTATFSFKGTGFRLFAAKDKAHGIMAVTVDDRAPVDADIYSANRVDTVIYELLNIPDGTHEVLLAHTGRKNASASNTFVLVDKVEVLTGMDNKPTPPPPVITFPPETPLPPVVGMPLLSEVGVPAGTSLTPISPTSIVPGQTYTAVNVKGNVEVGAGQAPITFINSKIDGAIVTKSPVNLTRSQWGGGYFLETTGGRIIRCAGFGRNSAFRPATNNPSNPATWYTQATPFVMEDTYLKIAQGVSPSHTEACQMLGGVGARFKNVVFDTGGPFNNTQTADLSMAGKDMLCEDGWFIGYGGYAIYADGPNNRFVRPHFARNTHPFGLYYPTTGTRIAPIVTGAVWLDGSPAPGP